MKKLYRLNFEKRKVIKFIFLYYLGTEFCIKMLGFPKVPQFLIDFLLIYLVLVCGIFKGSFAVGFRKYTFIAVSLVFLSLVGALVNSIPVFNWLWGLRMNFLGIAMFFSAIKYFRSEDVPWLMRVCFIWQIVNFGCSMYQWLVLGIVQDRNTGAFSNSAHEYFMTVTFTLYSYLYLSKKCSNIKFLFILFSALIMAGVGELKIVFVEVPLIFGGLLLTQKKGIKSMLAGFAVIVIMALGLGYLSTVNGTENLKTFTTEGVASSAFIAQDCDGCGYELPRVGSSFIISKKFFSGLVDELLGIGLGTAESSESMNMSTPFLKSFGWLHFGFFSFQALYLQMGALGVSMYLAFFILIFINNMKHRHLFPQMKGLYDVANIILWVTVLHFWYNSVLRSYSGILCFLFLALGPIISKTCYNMNMIDLSTRRVKK